VSEEERQLVRRALTGDEAAFEALHAAHAGRVRGYLLRSGFPPADADDLAQEAFLRASKSLKSFDPAKGSFRVWLGAIARNVARRKLARRAAPENFDPELAEEMLSGPPNPSETPEAREEIETLGACVGQLPAELGRLIRLRYVDGRTTRGIAEATGMPEATVRLRLAEALLTLERLMREKGFGE